MGDPAGDAILRGVGWLYLAIGVVLSIGVIHFWVYLLWGVASGRAFRGEVERE